jgi:NitT/TauT family transport system substrate-binding protein
MSGHEGRCGVSLRRRLVFTLVVALAALAAPATAGAQAPRVPRLEQPTTVKVGWTVGSLTLAGIYVGMERDYFRDSNITVELVTVDNINALIAPISTGQIDVATGGPSAGFFNAVARGVNLRIATDQNTVRPGTAAIALMVRKDLIDGGQVKTYADLRGKKIGIVAKRATMELDVLKALAMGGLKREDAIIVNMGFPQMHAALASKALDAAVLIEPMVSDAVAKGIAVRWKGIDEITPNRQNSFFMFSEQFAAKPDVARAWTVAYLRGVRDYYEAFHAKPPKGRAEMVNILIKHTLIKDPRTYDRMVLPAVDPNGELNVASIQEALSQFIADGDVKGPLDLDRIVDPRFIKYAQSVLGRYEKQP